MNGNTKYHVRLVIACRDGSLQLNEVEHRLVSCDDPEVWEFLYLSLNPEIYVDSEEHKRLKTLTSKFEIPEVLRIEL